MTGFPSYRREVDDEGDEPVRSAASWCLAMLTNDALSHPGQPLGPAARMAIGLTVCVDGPKSAAIAEIVVRSITNRRNTYRVHRRVVRGYGL